MTYERIPLVQKLCLIAERIELNNNKARSSGRIAHARRDDHSYHYLGIQEITWEYFTIVKGIFIEHFIEILIGYTHNHLSMKQQYLIFNKERQYGLILSLSQDQYILLNMAIYNAFTQQFELIHGFNKVECRILIRLLERYLHVGEIQESELDGQTKCNYSGIPFRLGGF